MTRRGRFLSSLAFMLAMATAPVLAQTVTADMTPVASAGLSRGQIVIDLAIQTRHPAYLEPLALKTPDGVRILGSVASPENARSCARGASSGSECRQVFRVTLDTTPRCHAGGDYEALYRVSCWPGTAASLCKPGAYRHDFKLGPEPLCADSGKKG